MTDNKGDSPLNGEELLLLMDKEDEYRPKSSGTKSTTNKDDLSDDDMNIHEEDDNDADWQELVDLVANAEITEKVRKSYRMNCRRFALFLYEKRNKEMKRKEQNDLKKYNILHDKFINELNEAVIRNKSKTFRNREPSRISYMHIVNASIDYLPINLGQLEAKVFLEYLLSISDTKDNDFLRSYGSQRSALTFLFKECRITPTEEFRSTLKSYMKGLKNTAAAARGQKNARLVEGKEPLPFAVYKAICLWMIQEGDAEHIFGHCFLTMTWNLMCRSANTVNVRLDHIASLDETVVGGYGRSCVLEAIKKNKCDLDDRVFRYLTITWKW